MLTNSKYFLSKDKVIYSYENNEYIFAKEVENISKEYLNQNILPFATYALDNLVKTNQGHMSSVVTLFLSSNSIDPELKNHIKKYKRRNSYKLGLRGYASTRIILFDNMKKELLYNSESKDVINFYKEVLK